MRVVCIQLSTGENIKKNIINVKKLIYKSIKLKADLILTPEATTLLTDLKKQSKCPLHAWRFILLIV